MKPLKKTAFFNNVILPFGCTILLLAVGGGNQIADGEEEGSGKSASSYTHIAANKQTSEKVKSGSSFRLPVYKPPKGIGAPGGRIGGATRGQDALAFFALVPDHLGLTINDQPTLYWYLSEPVQYELVVTVNDETQVMPIVETTITNTPRAGIHSFPTQKHQRQARLGQGVSVVCQPENRRGKPIKEYHRRGKDSADFTSREALATIESC